MRIRTCPKCGRPISYKRKDHYDRAVRKNSGCKSCSNRLNPLGKHHRLSEETKHKMSLSRKGKPGRSYNLGLQKMLATRKKNGWVSPRKGVKLSDITRQRIRSARIAYLTSNPLIGTPVSRSATVFLDGLEKLWGVEIEREFHLCGRFFDGRVGNKLIEVDSTYWHASDERKRIDKEKQKIAESNRYLLERYTVNNVSHAHKVLDELQKQR